MASFGYRMMRMMKKESDALEQTGTGRVGAETARTSAETAGALPLKTN